ncbi:GNAT family N-acetyltransferase [Aggregatilinea lenta]|uniref:GNAT family N-acetyltransferase n=1 Tax=Aggregatilinea lenta TaxID=913108 RepID=UPI000E5B6751|nr:GNAT family N-acetyltransferase [Aggregatilinea lenta]
MPVFTVGQVEARELTPQDAGALQTLLEACDDYTVLVEGQPPDAEAAFDVMADLAPGKTLDDKRLLGLWRGDRLVGVLDAMVGYPMPDVWFIGLLMIAPEQRGHGLGASVVGAFEAWAASQGARAIGLGVVEPNRDALRFWQRLGYAELRRTGPRPFGRNLHVVIVLQKALA